MEKKLKNLKVSSKLKLAFGSIIGMFVFAIILSVILTVLVAFSFRTFYTDAYSNSIHQLEIQRDIQMVGKLAVLNLNTEDAEEVAKYTGVINGKLEGISAEIATLQNALSDKQLVEQLATEFDKLKAIVVAMDEQITAQNKDAAFEIYDSQFYAQSEALNAALNQIAEYTDKTAVTELNTSSYLAIANIAILIILAIVSICMAIKTATTLGKNISLPVQELQQATASLRQGNLDIQIAYDSEDEFGQLATDFTATSATLHAIINDAGYLLGEMADGNFNINTPIEDQYVGEFNALLMSMRNLNRTLDGTLRQINEMSDQVAIGSDQLAQSSQALAEGATDQAGAVEELTATIENVTNIAAESAENATAAAGNMASAAKQAEQSGEEVQELIAAMERITETSKEIENIIGAIEDIASQTNLLSLNASIEAARAGEAGRGFAVVADQIGKLATDSAQSAVTTRELIVKSLQEVERGNEITQHTAAAIKQVLGNMEDFAKAAAGSAEGSRMQAEMLKQIEAGIEQISSVVQSNSASAQESSAVSEELSAQAESMKGLVDSFQLREV